MKVQVRFFAAAREAAKVASAFIELQEPATVGTLLSKVKHAFPALEPLLPKLRVAVDEEFASLEAPVTERSDVALIPPVAGG